jgi:hypothetical protein
LTKPDARSAEEEFEQAVRTAREHLRREEELARLDNDSTAGVYRALSAYMDVIASHYRLEKERIARPNEIHSRAEIALAHADLADMVADRIAQTAGRSLRTMTRTSYLWAAVAAVGAALLALMTGVELGSIWGTASATHIYQHADATVHAVAIEEGPKAVEDWDKLMKLNPVEPLLAECTRANLAVENGETGCRVWLRIGQAAMKSRSR